MMSFDPLVYCHEFLVLSSHTLPIQVECHFLSSILVVTIGFNGTYSVREEAGGITIVVLALMNTLAKDVVVTFSTLDDTARGGLTQLGCCHY